jgi:hypothetical protein
MAEVVQTAAWHKPTGRWPNWFNWFKLNPLRLGLWQYQLKAQQHYLQQLLRRLLLHDGHRPQGCGYILWVGLWQHLLKTLQCLSELLRC